MVPASGPLARSTFFGWERDWPETFSNLDTAALASIHSH